MRRVAIALLVLARAFASPELATAQEVVPYSYDAIGRLTEGQVSTGPKANNDMRIAYDAAGNRTCFGTTLGVVNSLCIAGGNGGGSGGGSGPWSSTLTAGTYQRCIDVGPYVGYVCFSGVGYLPPNGGAMSNVSYNGATITSLVSANGHLSLTINGASAPSNSGWTTITVPGVGAQSRSSATYTTSGTASIWQ